MTSKVTNIYRKYGFLLSQLIVRDFKTKYRRSILGILWSLLNPLLIMVVQYMVFSTLFRFDIPNYAVYLLSGIIMFNYMAEATNQSMTCIIQNASLINKVYIPKYIYPLSRVLSTGVNFLLSLLALYIVIIATGMSIDFAHLAMLYAIICMFVFILGVSLFLSSMMVFFRDTQFLYGIVLTIWTYITPIFYPENILPSFMLTVLKFNPMYHFIRFIRFIILKGGIPDPKAWVYCALFALLSFLIGAFVFNRTQNKFILNL
ncbi:ABC transporter permease [Paenibacillus polymyxa]|uniref:ABC transporter permease n=1 Tax=Paenibacillus polymyxa TaxID=1406 RepID=UPI0004D68937|nr:ABC transporter permease [Paenibacillus polymyxa]KEO78531.1 ABC transporter [Paenibacillus polymyxa]MCH6188198.1 ABC transporter permease [Paenibacillus polymyxa]MDY8092227.1 ABC transporter permease [Paenibacillus polymyxa]WRL57664.1 ABC transporter permease [Paenibacillus polymyxa]